jgi:hypothetical protein
MRDNKGREMTRNESEALGALTKSIDVPRKEE